MRTGRLVSGGGLKGLQPLWLHCMKQFLSGISSWRRIVSVFDCSTILDDFFCLMVVLRYEKGSQWRRDLLIFRFVPVEDLGHAIENSAWKWSPLPMLPYGLIYLCLRWLVGRIFHSRLYRLRLPYHLMAPKWNFPAITFRNLLTIRPMPSRCSHRPAAGIVRPDETVTLIDPAAVPFTLNCTLTDIRQDSPGFGCELCGACFSLRRAFAWNPVAKR